MFNKRFLVGIATLILASSLVVTKTVVSSAAPVVAFEATFDTAGDFYNRFDYGFSGHGPWNDQGVATPVMFDIHGDHNMACEGPNTMRQVAVTAPPGDYNFMNKNLDFSQLFWWCAPGNDPAKGHLMTGFTTTGYNHAWFSPKPEFTKISKVCWDQNANTIGGKWLEIQFVDHADATRYPVGIQFPNSNSWSRGTGGFDLGYTHPGFRPEEPGGIGPNNGLQPRSGNLAGLVSGTGGTIFDWFQGQNAFTQLGVGWPGNLPSQGGNPSAAASPVGPAGQPVLLDKATRYKHCIENASSTQIRVTFTTHIFPSRGWTQGGQVSYLINGQIPQDARRVVFHDSEYDGPKRGDYSSENITWHWDNIQIFTDDGVVIPPSSTTTLPPTTVSTTTTLPPTTVSTTTTTLPPTTVSTTTTLPPTTTTTLPATTTTLPAARVCLNGAMNNTQLGRCLYAIEGRLIAIQSRLS